MDILTQIWSTYIVNILDILIVAFIIYRILILIKGTRATQIVVGLIILVAITILARDILHLRTLAWLLGKFWFAAVLILAIIFQSEIRYALAKLGSQFLAYNQPKIKTDFLEEIVEASIEMSNSRVGALIIFEKEMGLKNYTDTGILMDAKVSHELIRSIFNTKAPVHDGAVIIVNERIHSAGCVLPISSEIEVRHLGTRHRAAIGISTLTDAIALVVSEETGNISIAKDGKISTIKQPDLFKTLSKIYLKKEEE
jgi:diadenylate cyclase